MDALNEEMISLPRLVAAQTAPMPAIPRPVATPSRMLTLVMRDPMIFCSKTFAVKMKVSVTQMTIAMFASPD